MCAALCDVGAWVCFLKWTVLEVFVLMASAKLTTWPGRAGPSLQMCSVQHPCQCYAVVCRWSDSTSFVA